jgi:hypothetical protein
MYICMHICSYMRSFLPQVLYMVSVLSKLYAHKNICIRKVLRPANLIKVFHGFPWSQNKCELVPKFHVALHASHAALPMVTLKILPYINMAFDFLLWAGPPCSWGIWVRESGPPGWGSLR